ncbi:MAG: hypothetical protein K6L73_06965 [Cellvibrionaceae bacterium]
MTFLPKRVETGKATVAGYLLLTLGLSIAFGILGVERFILSPTYWDNGLPLTINLNKLLASVFFMVAGFAFTHQNPPASPGQTKPLLTVAGITLLFITAIILVFQQTLLPAGIPENTNKLHYGLLFALANFLSACLPEQAFQIILMKISGVQNKVRMYTGLVLSSLILAALHCNPELGLISQSGTLTLIMIAFVGYGATWLLTGSLVISALSHLLVNLLMFFGLFL